MKKLFFLLVALLLVSGINAQVLKKGDNAVNFGLGIPRVYSTVGSISFPAIIASYELGVTEKLGIGYIGGGFLVAFSGAKYETIGVKTTYRNFVFGPRAAYHFDFAEITGSSSFDKLDIYAGVMIGFRIESYKTTIDNVFLTSASSSGSDFELNPDLFVGIRYNFNERIGIYAESGANVSFLNGGVTLRF